MRDLPRRTGTAILYGAVVLAAVFAPEIAFVLLLAVAGGIALAELVALRRAGRAAVLLGALVVFGLLALAVLRFVALPLSFVVPSLVPDSARTAGPLLWPYTLSIPYALLMVLAATWAADVFAYLGGSLFGRRKIAPRISPGKTWEGTIIGCVAATVVFLLLQRAFGGWYGGPLAYAFRVDVLVALGIGPVAFAGDVLESWVKRRAGVKDSGTFLPGHGGMLDRIDSLVATAPFVLLPLLFPIGLPSLG
jgi:phosphatidate cytidylyltransferase